MTTRNVVILAAGQGTRMKSKLTKVLHPICGLPIVEHVINQVKQLHPDMIVTIIGHDGDKVEKVLDGKTDYVYQKEQLGTGHGVLQAEGLLGKSDGITLVTNGDAPLFTAQTFQHLFEYHQQQKAVATVLTATAPDPTGYGRIVRDVNGDVIKIIEQKDATEKEAAINEVNTGVYCFDNKALFAALHKVTNNNAQGEYYLTDVIGILKNQGAKIAAYRMHSFAESMNVNTRAALAEATHMMQQRINNKHMNNGVTLIDPNNTYIDINVKIGADTVIEPGVYLKGNTVIGEDCHIGSFSTIIDSTLEDGVTVTSSTLESAIMRKHSNIGPNSHLRPKADIGEYVHIGNFCEVKNAQIGARTKVGHLSYVGDATLGSDVNVGCGTIFINYDGVKKNHADVGDHAFIGSDANIIAPVKISDHSFIAADTTVTEDVPYHAMAIGRARQTNKLDYWKKLPVANDPEWNK